MPPLSSHKYRAQANRSVVDANTLEAAIAAREAILSRNRDVEPILTLAHLAQLTNVELGFLRAVVARQVHPYFNFSIEKRDKSGSREISIPTRRLRYVQRFLHENVLKRLRYSNCSYSYAKDASMTACARQHLESRWLVKLDIRNFFGSVPEWSVYDIFRDLGFGELIAFEIARICTYPPPSSRRRLSTVIPRKQYDAISQYQVKQYDAGVLPMGAPSSPLLSERYLLKFDAEAAAIAQEYHVTFTRYADDLFFSASHADFNRNSATILVTRIRRLLKSYELTLNDEKVRIIPPGSRKIVLGLCVNDSVLRLPHEFKARMRRHYHYLTLYGVSEHYRRRRFYSALALKRHLLGKIAFATSVEPEYGEDLRRKHLAIRWP
jgi:RNA-directed DNA polymerase